MCNRPRAATCWGRRHRCPRLGQGRPGLSAPMQVAGMRTRWARVFLLGVAVAPIRWATAPRHRASAPEWGQRQAPHPARRRLPRPHLLQARPPVVEVPRGRWHTAVQRRRQAGRLAALAKAAVAAHRPRQRCRRRVETHRRHRRTRCGLQAPMTCQHRARAWGRVGKARLAVRQGPDLA